MTMKKMEDTRPAEGILKDWPETLLWSCQQKVMGYLYADDLENPQSVFAMLGDFSFVAGTPKEEVVAFKPEECKQQFMIMVPQNEEWSDLIANHYKERAKKVIRYAIKKEGDIFDREKLQKFVDGLKPEYIIKMIDEDVFRLCQKTSWCNDFISQYPDYKTYEHIGLGVVIMKGDEIVAGASSYSSYREGIEIEIDTRKDERRKGLATICGAKLILECLKRNLYPSWDAQNKWSVALAEKLGYHFAHEYEAYEIYPY